MNITVFGASGGIGAHLVTLAAQRGHQVRAVYRTTPQDPPPGQAEILIAPDIFDPALAAKAIRGADVVVTVVGPNFATRHNPRTTMTSPPDLHQRLARTLIAAMKDSAAPARQISVSTASMGPADTVMGAGPRLLFRFFRTVAVPNLGRVGKDLQAMEEELASSGLDWYALRLCVPRIPSAALTSKVALPAIRREDQQLCACGSCSSWSRGSPRGRGCPSARRRGRPGRSCSCAISSPSCSGGSRAARS